MQKVYWPVEGAVKEARVVAIRSRFKMTSSLGVVTWRLRGVGAGRNLQVDVVQFGRALDGANAYDDERGLRDLFVEALHTRRWEVKLEARCVGKDRKENPAHPKFI